tara:strand:+ start:184 stop:441 length:258 start_codon:yes stop_codon:yes gene_type:complete
MVVHRVDVILELVLHQGDGKKRSCLLVGVAQEPLQEEVKVRKTIPDVCRRYKITGIIEEEKNKKVVDHLDVEAKINGDQEKICLL